MDTGQLRRIGVWQETAVSAKSNVESQAAGREQAVEELITDEDGVLDPV